MNDEPRRLPDFPDLKRIGHITPSSNTVLEPLTAMMSSPIAHLVAHHFTRIRVTSISLASADTKAFDASPMLAAAQLLADGAMDAIIWNGTSGSWNGFEVDSGFRDRIGAETGVPASTSTLAQLDVFERHGIRRFGLAVPYLEDVTDRIVATYGEAGYEAVSVSNLGISVNYDFARVPLARIRQLLRDADSPEAECLVILCTNFLSALVVEEMERELGKPVFDSVAVTLWKALEMVGLSLESDGWGMLLAGTETRRSRT
jgi:maleate isomerase